MRAVRNAAAFRSLSGLSWREMLREGAAMRRGSELAWSQVIMAANTPMLLKAAMVDGRPDLGVMAAGQVVGVIDDLPSCAELIDRVMTQAHDCLARLRALLPAQPSGRFSGGALPRRKHRSSVQDATAPLRLAHWRSLLKPALFFAVSTTQTCPGAKCSGRPPSVVKVVPRYWPGRDQRPR